MLSFRRRKSARVGVRAALLAGATVAVVGFGTAGTAAASPSCTGGTITGTGSTLQKLAQEKIWSPNFKSTICPGIEVKYEGTGSGAGMKEWNHNGEKGSINTAKAFIGTDDAPTATQIANIDSVAGGAKLLTVPVAQTSIAIVANPPSGCPIEEIANKDLERIFAGTIVKWSQLSSVLIAPNPACNKRLKRVVRFEGSGTSYQFKNYLNLINKLKLPCVPLEGSEKTWAELEPIVTSEGKPNTVWPEDEGCAVPLSEIVTAKGGGALAETVYKTAGSIGYASLPDVESKIAKCTEEAACGNTEILEVQNNGKKKLEEATYVSPVSGEQANCATAQYKVPTNARVATTHTALDVDWSLVFGAKIDTTKTGGGYPLCTLTYDLAFNDYSSAGFTEEQATTVKDYLAEYITASTGQTDIAAKYYGALPKGTPTYNVFEAAQFTASKIGF
jgi:ABC-type phosphate transport system substrate-binding protein